MKKPVFIISLFLLYCTEALCIPANRVSRIVQQSDGTLLTIALCGDEYLHFFSTDDGYPVIEDSQRGGFCYASYHQQSLSSTGVLAHNLKQRGEKEMQYVRNLDETVRMRMSEIWAERMSSNRNIRKKTKTRGGITGNRNSYIGKKKGLVILVDFADLDMKGDNPQAGFHRMFNEKGYNENKHIGSVHDYFYAQSYGRFDLTFDVVGPVKMSGTYGYYGANTGGDDGRDRYPGTMVAEACLQVDDQVNFSDYDWDGDGKVDQIFVVYAGYGESNGAPSNTIWPHQSSLSSCASLGDGEGALMLDDVIVDTYACTCELAGTRGNTKNGIGTACHEFSHCLGLPDFYDVKYNGGFGMNYWDLMASGGHSGPNNNGEVPCGYSAYERWFAGWLDFVELNEPVKVSGMPSLGDEAMAYIVYNDNHRDEYFILENRQNTEWFSYVQQSNGCHGLIVTHVDYDKDSWSRNNVNTSIHHQRMSIIPADNDYGRLETYDGSKRYSVTDEQLKGDPFPGLSNVTALTNTSHASVGGKLFNRNTDGSYYLNKPIEKIKEKNGLISFYFMGGIYVPSPLVSTPTGINNRGFTACWETVKGADGYSVELTELREQGIPSDNILLSENMDKFKTSPKLGDGYEDLASNLDKYMDNRGWTGLKVFTSPYGAKIGTSSVEGYLTSPQLECKSRNITLSIIARTSEGDEGNLEVLLLDADGNEYSAVDIPLNKDLSSYVVNLEDVEPGDYKVSITSSWRIYIGGLAIYDGYYSEENIEDDGSTSQISMSPQDKVVVDDIVSNNYAFENLSGCCYQYRVKALMDGAESAWSDYMLVNLTTGMSTVNTDVFEDKQEYFLLNGRKASSVNRPGLYIVKQKKGKVKIINSK